MRDTSCCPDGPREIWNNTIGRRPLLHDLGECELKHGMRVGIVNLYTYELGNAETPSKLKAFRGRRARVRCAGIAAALLMLAAIASGLFLILHRPARAGATMVENVILRRRPVRSRIFRTKATPMTIAFHSRTSGLKVC